MRHPWLGDLGAHGRDLLVARVDISTTIWPALNDDETDVMVLIYSAERGEDFPHLVNAAATRTQNVLANLESIKTYAIEHAPTDWRPHLQTTDTAPIPDRLHLDDVSVLAACTVVSFSHPDLGILDVQTDLQGQCEAIDHTSWNPRSTEHAK
ncbi:hypothetical protein DZF91_36910 [Actinomadura logoneensis]|uniref:Uncharacterized protein n=1 Tax=Actinomadura logoneensis TaxID=2293572 RepID=A0A372JA26_9ACTN|nr:hypothetical protein [Actinomadura logoneensis]RFU36666.1 hypothetical protein DZF91_36910 [Actinomadura logoneensis]